jgi:hypothetical protein
MLAAEGKDASALDLADLHCRRARRRIGERFRALLANDDRATHLVAKRFLEGDLVWLEAGIVPLDEYRAQAVAPTQAAAVSREPARVG